jgi:hypothetical protein
MKKLEDIPKKEIFNVPDGYFEKLPGVIQSRIAEGRRDPKPAFRYAFQVGVPALAMILFTLWYFRPDPMSDSPENILASLETQDLVAYLNETDMTTDELLDEALLDNADAQQIEEAVYDLNLGEEDLENIEDDFDL